MAKRRSPALAVSAILVATLLLTLLVLRGRQPGSEAAAWIFSAKLRAAYCPDPSAYAENLSRAGLNSVIWPLPRAPLDVDRMRSIGEHCKEKGLHLFVSIYWLSRSYLSEGNWRKSVTKDGFIADYAPPCPFDEDYLDAIITNQTLAVARISRECGIEGIMYDAELYGAWPTRYSNLTCFCDHCFYGFARSIGRQEQVEKSQRYAWLQDAGALDRYYSYLGDTAVEMFSKVARQARKLNPDLIFGVLGNPLDNWYTEAMAKAFSAKGLPFVVLDESTYRFGFSTHSGWFRTDAPMLPEGLTYAESQVERIRERKLNAVWAGGVELLRWFYPVTVPYHLYSLAVKGGGYWLFYISAETATSEWWDAYRLANSEIDQTLQLGDRPSPFQFNPNSFDPVDIVDAATSVQSFVPLEYGKSAGGASVALSGLNTAVIFAEHPRMGIQVQAGSGVPCLAALFDSKGSLLRAMEVETGTRGELSTRHPVAGTVDKTTVPLPTILRANSTVPYILSADKASWALVQPVEVAADADFYWMPPSNETTIQVFCTGKGVDRAFVRIVCGGTVIADMPARDTLSFPVFTIPASEKGKVCRISLHNVSSPLSLSLKSWAPYLALRLEDVLVPVAGS